MLLKLDNTSGRKRPQISHNFMQTLYQGKMDHHNQLPFIWGTTCSFWDAKNFCWDTKNFCWDTKDLRKTFLAIYKTFLGIQTTFLGYKQLFWDAKCFFGIQNPFFRDLKSCFWLTKIPKHHTKITNISK